MFLINYGRFFFVIPELPWTPVPRLHAGRAASRKGDEEDQGAQEGALLVPRDHFVCRFRLPLIFCDVFQHDVNQRGENVRFIVMFYFLL